MLYHTFWCTRSHTEISKSDLVKQIEKYVTHVEFFPYRELPFRGYSVLGGVRIASIRIPDEGSRGEYTEGDEDEGGRDREEAAGGSQGSAKMRMHACMHVYRAEEKRTTVRPGRGHGMVARKTRAEREEGRKRSVR